MDSSQFGSQIDNNLIQKMMAHVHKADPTYISRHPELIVAARDLLQELTDKQPENITEFLVTKMKKLMKRINKIIDKMTCTEEESDGDDSFSPPTSTQSLHSISADIDRLYSYARNMRDKK